jgi:ketosteroid isomerase-like protein
VSAENVATVRRGFEAYERGDFQAMIDYADPELITYRAPPNPDAGTYHGPQGFIEALVDWTEGFDEFQASLEEVIDANEEQVIARVHQTAVGSESRAPIEADFWFLYTFRGEKIVRLDLFIRRSQAFEAAGLQAE